MLDHQTATNGYTECNPPVLVRDEAMYGTDKLPKFAEDSFRTTDGRWPLARSTYRRICISMCGMPASSNGSPLTV